MKLRIKENCTLKGITQKELASQLGVSEVTLSRATNGNTSLDTLEKIAKALGVEVWELFTPSTSSSDFMALVKSGDSYFHASSLTELKSIITELEAKP